MRLRTPYALFLVCAISICAANEKAFAQPSVNSRKATSLMLQGVQLFENGQTETAGEKLRAAQELSPSDDAVQYYLGYVEATLGNTDAALKHFKAAYDADSTNYWYSMRLARLYLAMNKVAQAGRINQRLLERRPNDLNVISSVIELYLQEEKLDKADSLLSHLERIAGESEYSQMVRLEILRLKGDFTAFFSGMNEIFANNVIPAKSKIKMLDNMLKGSDPRFNYVHLSDYEQLTSTCLECHPGDTSVTHFAAGFYFSIDRPDDIIALYRSNPLDCTLASITTFACLEKKKDAALALEYCDRWVSLATTPGERVSALTTKADCYQHLDRMDDAFREYEKALRVDPGNIMTLNNYAYNLAVVGRNLTKAARLSRKTIEAEPENATYLDTYAWILYRQKKYKSAKLYLKKAMIYGGKDNPEVLNHYAATLEALGESTLAEGYRQKAKLKKDAKK